MKKGLIFLIFTIVSMNILVINSGSSSIKFQLVAMPQNEVLVKGLIERIGLEAGIFKYEISGAKTTLEQPIASHTQGIKLIIDLLSDSTKGIIADLSEIGAVGHRVVHGEEKLSASTFITDETIEIMTQCERLSPLHNPANKLGILACREVLPSVPQVAVMDTGFHQTMEPEAFLYPLPKEYYDKYRIRRYGFHGTSHRYVSARALEILGKDAIGSKMITCHVGNGASMAAIKDGKSVDTSMGMTPLEGLMMGTRSGDIDPAIPLFLMKAENMSVDDVENMLNKKSGILGVSRISSDLRDIEDGFITGNPEATLAMNMYIRRIVKYIGSYVAVLNGVDTIVLTAGVLENSSVIRSLIVKQLGWLGIKLDESKNNFRGEERVISTPDSAVTVIVVPTNEEYIIAKDAYELCK